MQSCIHLHYKKAALSYTLDDEQHGQEKQR